MYPKAEPLSKVERYFPGLFNKWVEEAKDKKEDSSSEMIVSVEQDMLNKEKFVEYYLHKVNFEMMELMEDD